MKNQTFLLLLLVVLIACSDDDSTRKIKVDAPITLLDVDDTGTVDQEIQMHVRATAPNGCFSDLEIQLEEIDERHHILTAMGMMRISNACPYNLVTRDTIIRFTPPLTGSYYFSANKPGFTILRDTLEVE